MSALPTLGRNNGQASAINTRGQIVGFAENGAVDSSCPAGTTNNRIQLPVLWENGKPLLFLRVAIQTGTHFGSTIEAKP